MSSCVLYLQPEIVEIIFSHLDGKSLARCERVCKLWKKIVHGVSQRTNIWRICCEKEIGRDVRIDILNNFYPWWQISSPSNLDWRIIYRLWCQWRCVRNWSFINSTVFHNTSFGSVNCMKVSGNCVVTGHRNGYVLLWKHRGHHTSVTHHVGLVESVSTMAFSGKNKDIAYQLKHDLVVSAGNDNIQINPLTFQDENPNGYPVFFQQEHKTTCLRTFGNLICTVTEGLLVTIWQLEATANNEMPKILKMHSFLAYNIIETICIWGNRDVQVTAVTRSGCFPVYRGGKSSSYKLQPNDAELFLIDSDLDDMDSARILSVFFWRYGVCITLTDDRYMYVKLNGYKKKRYNTMPCLHSYPVTILLYGETLLLGLESGTLVMYYLSDIKDLMNLDLTQFSWKHSLSSDPIISLDVAETKNGPTLAAATECRVHMISFIPPHVK